MKNTLTLILTLVLFLVGVAIVASSLSNPVAISFGMVLVAVSILNVAVQFYFPAQPSDSVELKVVDAKEVEKPKKRARTSKKRGKK